jgi:hypothetical protein
MVMDYQRAPSTRFKRYYHSWGFVLVAGILIFITEMLESWLSHGQAALVDGLQAG